MRNLFRFIKVYHFFLLFILVESFSLFWYISSHDFQKNKTLSFLDECTGTIYESYNDAISYLSLSSKNKYLKEEVTRLSSIVDELQFMILENQKFENSIATKEQKPFKLISGKITKNSINKKRNIIELNVGKKDGVQPGMGIIEIDQFGIIGIIATTTTNYSKAISVLNERSEISVKHDASGQNGYLKWSLSLGYKNAKIINIPNHENINIGDTIKTNGYGNKYPAEIPVGIIESFNKNDESSFYNINMRFINDINSIDEVHILQSLTSEEKEKL